MAVLCVATICTASMDYALSYGKKFKRALAPDTEPLKILAASRGAMTRAA